MSAGFIFDWRMTGVVGSIHVTQDFNVAGSNIAFSINNCSPGLRNFLLQRNIPPTPPVQVNFNIVFWNGHLFAVNVG